MLTTLRSGLVRLSRLVLLGVLTLTPLLVTVWLAVLLVQATARLGGLLAQPVAIWLPGLPQPVGMLANVVLALAVLALVGGLANSVIGRRIGSAANQLIDQVPGAKTVYRGVQKMLASFNAGGDDSRKVVLIDFPSPEMKAVGLVTRRFKAADTGQELAAVYVPTTPNPSSGYIEIVPVERLVWLDWSAQEAIQFIMSGGVIGPDRILYDPRAAPPPEAPPRTSARLPAAAPTPAAERAEASPP